MAMKDAIAASASSSSDDGTTSNETIARSSQLSVIFAILRIVDHESKPIDTSSRLQRGPCQLLPWHSTSSMVNLNAASICRSVEPWAEPSAIEPWARRVEEGAMIAIRDDGVYAIVFVSDR